MKYVFVADIDGDIDDIIAIEWLHREDLLECVVMDGQSRNSSLEAYVSNLPARFSHEIPNGTKIVLCGGSLTKVADYLKSGNTLELLIMNGGFAGTNLVDPKDELPKFKNKKEVRTYNFNLDLPATNYVLTSKDIGAIYLISKNVCHHIKNTLSGIYNGFKYDWIYNRYRIRDDKRLHDLLMSQEGVKIINGDISSALLSYKQVKPYYVKNDNDPDNMAKWGSELNDFSNIFITVGWIK